MIRSPGKTFRPLACVLAFFNPVSRTGLDNSFQQSDAASKETQATIANSQALHQEVRNNCLPSDFPALK